LLRSTRKEYHQRIVEALEGQFPEIMQPSLNAGRTLHRGAFYEEGNSLLVKRSEKKPFNVQYMKSDGY